MKPFFSPTRLALGFLLLGREIVSGSSGIRRGTGSPSSCAQFPQHRPSSPRPQECQKCQRIALPTSVSTRTVKKCLGDFSFHTSCQKMSWRPQFPPELSKKCFGDLSFPNSCCPNVVASMFFK